MLNLSAEELRIHYLNNQEAFDLGIENFQDPASRQQEDSMDPQTVTHETHEEDIEELVGLPGPQFDPHDSQSDPQPATYLPSSADAVQEKETEASGQRERSDVNTLNTPVIERFGIFKAPQQYHAQSKIHNIAQSSCKFLHMVYITGGPTLPFSQLPELPIPGHPSRTVILTAAEEGFADYIHEPTAEEVTAVGSSAPKTALHPSHHTLDAAKLREYSIKYGFSSGIIEEIWGHHHDHAPQVLGSMCRIVSQEAKKVYAELGINKELPQEGKVVDSDHFAAQEIFTGMSQCQKLLHSGLWSLIKERLRLKILRVRQRIYPAGRSEILGGKSMVFITRRG